MTSYFDGGGWGAKGFHDFPAGYDHPFVMPPDWPGDEPVWAAYCNQCPWRYEGPQSKAIGKFINHCAVGTPYEHRINYIHLGTCWHTFVPENPLEYIHAQNHAKEMIKQAGRSYAKRSKFNDECTERVARKMEELSYV